MDNILYNNKGEIKIADFGLAKKFKKPMTERVQCLKYRAPERLLGNNYIFIKSRWKKLYK